MITPQPGASPGAGASIPGRTGGIPGQPPTFSQGTAPGTPPAPQRPAIGGLQTGISTAMGTAQGPGSQPQPAQNPSTYPKAPTPTTPPATIGQPVGSPGVSNPNFGQNAPGSIAPAGNNAATSPNLATAMMGSAPGMQPGEAMGTVSPQIAAMQSTQQNPVTGASAPSTGQQFAPVSPGSNLIGSQINLQQSPNTQQSGQEISNLANNLSNPDVYQQAALGSFNTFAQQTNPAYQAAIRQATAQAAANGGIGSGALSTTYGNLANERNLQLEGMQQQAQQAALTGQAQYQLQQLGALQGVNSQQFGQNQATTNQLNQQQNYQNQLQQQAINNAVEQTGLEGQLQGQNFAQQMALANFGYSGNPDQMSAQLANQYGQVGQNTANQLGNIAQQQGINGALNGLTAGGQGLYNLAANGGGVPQTSGLEGLTTGFGTGIPSASGIPQPYIDPSLMVPNAPPIDSGYDWTQGL